MDEAKALTVIAGAIAQVSAFSEGDVTIESEIERDLGISSLERVMLAVAIEDAFAIEVSDEIATAVTVKDLVEMTQRATSE